MENWNVSSNSLDNTQFVKDPFRDEGEEELVLSVNYPRGTREGSQFFMTPMRADSNVQTAVLQYEVSRAFISLELRFCIRRWFQLSNL